MIKKLMGFFTKSKSDPVPLLIIKKAVHDVNVKEYNSIEEAITDLENDPNVPTDKIDKLKSSLQKLKSKSSIKIKNGEIIKWEKTFIELKTENVVNLLLNKGYTT